MLRATEAGAHYAIIAFLIGFMLGTIRVLLLAPRLGETTAVIVEVPMMLAASRFVCRWCMDRLDVGELYRLVVDGLSPVPGAEFGLGAALGRSLGDQVATYQSLTGASGLAAHVIFAMFPVIQVWRRFDKTLDRQNTAAF